jgi:hypothetical protein
MLYLITFSLFLLAMGLLAIGVSLRQGRVGCSPESCRCHTDKVPGPEGLRPAAE